VLYLYQRESDAVPRRVRVGTRRLSSRCLPSNQDMPLDVCLTASVIHTKKSAEFLNIQT